MSTNSDAYMEAATMIEEALKMDRERCRELAAQVWCRNECKDKFMDSTLAEAFAIVLEHQMKIIETSNVALVAALKRYGSHDWDCMDNMMVSNPHFVQKCTCGFDNALANAKKGTLE